MLQGRAPEASAFSAWLSRMRHDHSPARHREERSDAAIQRPGIGLILQPRWDVTSWIASLRSQ
jgi:hypothetical protein